jgi:aspartyl-tRNA(Asn)/glutamyl-tRNA(Gln) amidotransferase subunit C
MSASVTAETEPTAGVSEDEVRHVADLANLELTAEELPRMARDLNAVLGYIDQLNELDTAAIAPMAQVGEALGHSPESAGETLRRDEIKPSVDRAAVMSEAPETDGRFFKVPKVIER